jgi:hypothetical protein
MTLPLLAGAGFSQSPRLGGYGCRRPVPAGIIIGIAWLTAVSVRALQRTLPRQRRNILICAPSVEEHPGNRRRSDRRLSEVVLDNAWWAGISAA